MSKSPNKIQQQTPKPKSIIQIQFCSNCDTHLFLVKHQEAKYLKHYEQLKRELEEHNYIVKKKTVPNHIYKNSPYCPPNLYYHNQTNQVVYFPSLGSFEVYYQNKKIYSKLQHLKWPTLQIILSYIQNIQQSKPQQNKQTQVITKQNHKDAQQQEIYDHRLKKGTFYIKNKVQGQKILHRYSVEKRNLFIKPQINYISRKHNSFRVSSNSERLSYTRHHPSNSNADKQTFIQNSGSNFNNLVTPIQEPKVSSDKPEEPKIKSKNVRPNGNIYLQPLFPKTSVNLQNFNKQKLIFSQKIHEQKIKYNEQKSIREQAARLKKIEEQKKQKLKLQQALKQGKVKGINYHKKSKNYEINEQKKEANEHPNTQKDKTKEVQNIQTNKKIEKNQQADNITPINPINIVQNQKKEQNKQVQSTNNKQQLETKNIQNNLQNNTDIKDYHQKQPQNVQNSSSLQQTKLPQSSKQLKQQKEPIDKDQNNEEYQPQFQKQQTPQQKKEQQKADEIQNNKNQQMVLEIQGKQKDNDKKNQIQKAAPAQSQKVENNNQIQKSQEMKIQQRQEGQNYELKFEENENLQNQQNPQRNKQPLVSKQISLEVQRQNNLVQ